MGIDIIKLQNVLFLCFHFLQFTVWVLLREMSCLVGDEVSSGGDCLWRQLHLRLTQVICLRLYVSE